MVAGPQDAAVEKAARSWSIPNKGVLLLLAFVVAAMGVAEIWHAEMRAWVLQFPAAPVQWLSDHVARPLKWSITANFLSSWFLVGVAVIFLLECWRPARPQQPLITSGLICDALWVPGRELGRAVFVFGWIDFMDGLYAQHLSFMAIDSVTSLPWVVQVVWALVLVDLLTYVVHRLNHRVPLFWEFHAVHHAQRELNFLTERRLHFGEFFVAATIYAIPVGVLGLDVATVGSVALVVMWHTRLVHSNLRTHFGPLRYLLVTPQSHRVHHGVAPRYHNRNFGAMFSVWDQILGTQHYGWGDYPDTGTEDETFPQEQAAGGLRFLLTPVLQMIHPFRRIARGEMTGAGPRPARSV